jgi:hypothetical protein
MSKEREAEAGMALKFSCIALVRKMIIAVTNP